MSLFDRLVYPHARTLHNAKVSSKLGILTEEKTFPDYSKMLLLAGLLFLNPSLMLAEHASQF